MSLDDYYKLNGNERERLYENLFKDKSDDEINVLRNQIEDEIDAIYEEVYVQQRELENIIDSKNTSVQDAQKAAFYLTEVEKMISTLESFSSDWGNAKASKAKHSVDATDGVSYSFRAGAFVTDGEEFVIRSAGGSSGTPGIFGEIEEDETDPTPQDIFLELNPTDALEIAHYNPDTGDVRFAVTTGPNTTYYVTIRGGANIRLSGSTAGLTPATLASWPTALLGRMYETAASDTSFQQQMTQS